ncbi:MAG TPA: TonB-dependent receptor plug domain-containing protein [Bacteroidales bacterium]|nr:TonB-dependent receptor plug domain-containing protein [Bacteroidales bacterium]
MKFRLLLPVLFLFIAINDLPGQKAGKKVTISGIVVDINNNPVSEAFIMIDGKNTDKRTQNNGTYKIKTSTKSDTIGIFTFSTGVSEQPINNRTVINFVLGNSPGQDNNSGNTAGEDLVNVGYGTVDKKDLTVPVNRIEGTDKNFSNYSNIYEMIKGQVPSVEVSGKSIRIQGSSSLGSTEPLFVVDGIVSSSIDDIPPSQVKSIEVLKGSSAAIYGSRGANGVILIRLISASDMRTD